MPPGLGRLVLVDASALGEDGITNLLRTQPSLKMWYHGRADAAKEKADATKLAALQQARDVGALGEDEYYAAVMRLLPDPFDLESEKLRLLTAAYEGDALTESQFREAVGRLHLAMGYEVGDRVEYRDHRSEWQLGTITNFSTDEKGTLCVSVRPDGGTNAHVYQHIRRPAGNAARSEVEELRRKLTAAEDERTRLQEQVDRFIAEARGSSGALTAPSRTLATPTPPQQGRYELYGFAFGVAAAAPIQLTAVGFGSRAAGPVRVTVYSSTAGADQLRRDPSKWTAVSATMVIAQEAGDERVQVPLSTPIVVEPNCPVRVLIHSPDDIQAVVYHRADPNAVSVATRRGADPTRHAPSVTAQDGCVQILAGDAAQASMIINNSHSAFAFCGQVEYSLLDAEVPGSGPHARSLILDDGGSFPAGSTPYATPRMVPGGVYGGMGGPGVAGSGPFDHARIPPPPDALALYSSCVPDSRESSLPAGSLAAYSRESQQPPLPLAESWPRRPHLP